MGRLEAAAQPLPADRRSELVAEVRDHIESALAESDNRDEIAARNVLERLGEPEEIVAAETGGASAPARPPVVIVQRSGWGATELAAILFLTVGAVFLPVVGPLIGLVLVWASSQWTTRQKWVATAIVLILLVLPVALLLGVNTGSGGGGA
jgi:hypothetical protein